jgi:hypothetical protein
MSDNPQKVYVPDLDTIRVNQPIIGWDNNPTNPHTVVTTPVVTVEQTSNGLLATTEADGHYLISNRR